MNELTDYEKLQGVYAQQDQIAQLTKERAQLAAKVAAYEHVIQLAWEDRRDDSDAEYAGKLAEAKCNDQCGVGWISPEKKKVLVEALDEVMKEHSATMREVSEIGYSEGLCLNPSLYLKAKQALEAVR